MELLAYVQLQQRYTTMFAIHVCNIVLNASKIMSAHSASVLLLSLIIHVPVLTAHSRSSIALVHVQIKQPYTVAIVINATFNSVLSVKQIMCVQHAPLLLWLQMAHAHVLLLMSLLMETIALALILLMLS
jgi:hypothetical protein